MSRTDSATRIIHAAPEIIYAALTDPNALAAWRAPDGMRGEILDLDPAPGGRLRMALHYEDPSCRGKSDAHTDIFESRFVALDPHVRVVEEVVFESEDPAFAGTMTVTTTLSPAAEGTEVTIACSNVPPGIDKGDHLTGLASTLENLARHCMRGE